MNITHYITLARIDSWTKNIVVLLGVFTAYALSTASILPIKVILTLIIACLASSANYVLNESLDTRTDVYHPIKSKRAGVKNALNYKIVACEYIGFVLSALTLAYIVGSSMMWVVIVYVICAWLYNIPPIRLKDKAYCDVILESINYPLRVLLGWLCVLPEILPPVSILVITWSLGAFTMSLKRLAEFQLFTNKEHAVSYRRSYASYTTNSLALCGFIYAMFTIFGVTVLLLKYKIELIILMPVFIALLAWYFLMGLQQRLFVIYPERLLSSKMFITFLCGYFYFNHRCFSNNHSQFTHINYTHTF